MIDRDFHDWFTFYIENTDLGKILLETVFEPEEDA